ncbi:putative glucose-induced degradation complex subunit [Clavispora lusitaniae]|uniref:Glucose-induced degradation complex subunit n=1 Tax=Clavispora lusitaniae TaxID=36911 RepID=A0AA91Q3R6_CLALS|nr:putative glucose-induced degradation complex subunit [Clavispora lusitaniae]
MSKEFQLQLIRKTLSELGQFSAVEELAKNSPPSEWKENSFWVLSTAIKENLAVGNYAAILSLFSSSPDEFTFDTALSSALEHISSSLRSIALYLTTRTQFLEKVLSCAFGHEPVSAQDLVHFLQNSVASAYNKLDLSGYSGPLASKLTREKEGSILLPLTMTNLSPENAIKVLDPTVVLTKDSTMNDLDTPKFSAYAHCLRNSLLSLLQELFQPLNTKDGNHFEIPDNCLADLIHDALLYRSSHNIFYLPPRTQPLDAKDWPLRLLDSGSQHASRNDLPISLLHTLSEHSDEVWFTRFSPSGRFLATGSLDGTCIIYDVVHGFKVVATLDATAENEDLVFLAGSHKPDLDKKKGIIYLCWEPYERYIVTCCLDTVIRIWKIENLHIHKRMATPVGGSKPASLVTCFTLGERMRTWPCQFLNYEKELSPHFIVGSPDKVLKVFAIDGSEVLDFYSDADEWSAILEHQPSSASGSISSASETGETKSETPKKEESYTSNSISQFNRINDFSITPNGKVLITANNDKQVHFYKIPNMFDPAATTALIASLTLNGRLTSCSVSASGQYLLLSVAPEELQVWDISPLQKFEKPFLKQKFLGQSQAIYMVRSCFGYLKTSDRKEELVLSGSDDGYIYIWKLETGQFVTRVKGHHGLCNSVDWNRFYVPEDSSAIDYGTYWSSVGDDKLVKIWGPSS